jgi:hypothetical protein
MRLLSFEKPKKIRSVEEHNKINSSDCEVEGTYVPNMSHEDNFRWKGKHIKGDNERVEIRKSFGTQVVIVVYKEPFKNGQVEPEEPEYDWSNYNEDTHEEYRKRMHEYNEWFTGWHGDIKISMNGSLWLSNKEYEEMIQAIEEAKEYMKT